ncbi:MAG: PEP/pyruvate-binding domain-containing protein, partial [Chloroflexota bacterium]|nr:PEP/pyruvate-binding domain-containing protein [Chloroflexota bacterium]
MDTQPQPSRKTILWLGESECHDPYHVGGKAASLSRLAQHHPVPPGFAITATSFQLAAAGLGAAGTLNLPEEVRNEVAAAYLRLAERCGLVDVGVAVRSSAVDEDGGDASFAGQHETFLNVAGVDSVVEAVEQCWVSFSAPHAVEYRRKQGLPVEKVRAAVLVQQLVVADVSAVMFTADPVSGRRSEIVINASWGLGESIVGGTVTPDVCAVAK